jgi:hypothetical protein
MSITPTAEATFINSGRWVIAALQANLHLSHREQQKSEEYGLRYQVFSCRNEIVKHILFCILVPASCHLFRIRHHLVN